MKDRLEKTCSFLRTTAIGGLLFLFPLAVIGAILGYVYSMVVAVYEPLKEQIPVQTATGQLLLFVAAVAILVMLCFLCGLFTKRAIARRFSSTVEKQLTAVFPKYAIYKDILAGNLGGNENSPSLEPVSVRLHDHWQLALEADRLPDGCVVIYIPGAPDTWNGTVIVVSDDQVEPLNIPFPDALAIFERLGRKSARWFAPREA